jgi:hypothetical protein
MDKVTQSNASAAEEAAAASEELAAQAQVQHEQVRHLEALVGASSKDHTAVQESYSAKATHASNQVMTPVIRTKSGPGPKPGLQKPALAVSANGHGETHDEFFR